MHTCYLCNSTELRVHYGYPTFQLMKCSSCGLIVQLQRKHVNVEQLIDTIYNDSWVQMRDTYSTTTFETNASFKTLLLEMHYPQKGKLLEIGSGTGEFLYLANQAGWDVVGIEPSDQACEYAKKTYNLDLVNDIWEPTVLNEDEKFDAITFWHVLEHIIDPIAFLESFKAYLKPDGKLLFCIPNNNSFTNRILGAHSPLYTEADHIFHYSRKNLELLVEKSGFKSLTIFSRESPAHLQKDLLWKNEQLDTKAFYTLQAKLQANFEGHELFCIATLA